MSRSRHDESAPFRFPGRPDAGVLCIHGFTGTPFEMRYLGQRLSERGYTAVGPTLPGHGTRVEDLDATTWRDWYQGVAQAFDALRVECAQVAVVGQSLGGLLALYLAAERGDDMVAVVSLATPLWLFPLARSVVWATRPEHPLGDRAGRALRRLPKIGGSDLRDREMKRRNPCYQTIPLRALHELVAFMGEVEGSLPRVRVPTLVMHARQDHTAPYASSERIAARVAAGVVRHRPLDRSYHLIAVDVERDLVAGEVAGFLDATALGPAQRARSAQPGEAAR